MNAICEEMIEEEVVPMVRPDLSEEQMAAIRRVCDSTLFLPPYTCVPYLPSLQGECWWVSISITVASSNIEVCLISDHPCRVIGVVAAMIHAAKMYGYGPDTKFRNGRGGVTTLRKALYKMRLTPLPDIVTAEIISKTPEKERN